MQLLSVQGPVMRDAALIEKLFAVVRENDGIVFRNGYIL
jgi:hypothetical protein